MSVETASMPWNKHPRLGNFLVFCVQAASQLLHFQSQQVSCRKVCAFFMLLCCLHFEFRTGRQMCSWDSNHRWNKLFQWFNATRPGPVLPTPLWKLDPREEQPSSPAAATLTWFDWFDHWKVPKTKQTLTCQVHVPCLFGNLVWTPTLREIPLKSFNISSGREIPWVRSFCSSLR